MRNICIFFIVYFINGAIKAQTILVPQDYSTIQLAINSANEGDTIIVSQGTYYENINFNGKGITVSSSYLFSENEADINNTIIDGNNQGSVAIFENSESNNSVLLGFTLQNGSGTIEPVNGRLVGGGIYCYYAFPKLENLIVKNNSTIGSWSASGGGIFMRGYGIPNLKVNHVLVKNNAANFIAGIETRYSNALFENVIVENNEGHGFYSWKYNPILKNCKIINNTGFGIGAELCIPNATNFRIENTLITGNGSEGIYLSGSHLEIINSTIANNLGAGINSWDDGSIYLINSIVYFNGLDEISFGSSFDSSHMDIAYSDIEGGQLGVNTNGNGTYSWESGNIQSNPLFVDESNNNYYVQNSSPCKETGIAYYEINNTVIVDYEVNSYFGLNPEIGLLSPGLYLSSFNGETDYLTGRNQEISWESLGILNINIEYSINGGITWSSIISGTTSDGNYLWTLPETPSTNCLVRISDSMNPFVSDQSDNYFSIIDPFTYIPDDNFEQALIDQGIDSDGVLNNRALTQDLVNVTELSIHNLDIQDLSGIEDFVNLMTLGCAGNLLSNINLSSNIHLEDLYLRSNNLNSIDLSNNLHLKNLYIAFNPLTTIDVSNNINLEILRVSSTQLTTIDIGNNLNLIYIDVSFNDLFSSIDLSNNIGLLAFDFINTNLSSIDISTNINLTYFSIRGNNLNNIDISNNSLLTNIDVSNNILTDLDLSNNINLEYLTTYGNAFLGCIKVSESQFDNIPEGWLIGSNAIYSLDCQNTYIPDNNFEQDLIDLGYDFVLDDSVLIDNISNVSYLDLNRDLNNPQNQIEDITGIEDFLGLDTLYVASNILTSIDVSSLVNIKVLGLIANSINSINVSNNEALTDLSLAVNNLSSIDVTNNNQLTSLILQFNEIEVIDLANNPNLITLGLAYNNFTEIDISNIENLWDYFDIRNNPLTCIQVSQNQLENIPSTWYKDSNDEYHTNCNDFDNDNVVNELDLCPDTPNGELVNSDGCSESQLDGDNDGVMNEDDLCPLTPIGEQVNSFGCSESQLDDDNDGVMNNEDLCPDTPAGEAVNSNGCSDSQLDNDNDEVMNDVDLCPDTPPGESVNSDGCSESQLDEDNDGVMNNNDYCPGTPPGEPVNSIGCSESQIDDDNDGIMNNEDLCPDTPTGEAVNIDGCSDSQLDDDNDGVMNSDDYCPNTPLGEPVNSIGCSESQIDDDNDGIMNNEDLCPETPAGEAVNIDGCSDSQLDDDNDGVMNNNDYCPDTPPGEPVNSIGCSESQIDDDNDGVMNSEDLCPNTPSGETVNTDGCAESQLDDDGDGVMNDEDLCPDTPLDEVVDINGCSETQLSVPNNILYNKLKVYPNPTQGNLTIELSQISFINEVEVELYDAHNHLIFTKEISVIDHKVRIAINEYPPGLYFAIIYLESPVVIKIILE